MKKLFVPALFLLLVGCQAGVNENSFYSGTIEGKTVHVQSEVSGKITDIFTSEGERISKDDDVLALDTETLEIELENAEADVEIAKARKEEAEEVGQDYRITQAEEEIKKAENQVRLLELNLEKSTIEAVIDGVVQTIYVHEGEIAQAGQVLMSVTSDQQLELTIYVAEKDLNLVELGHEVEVQVSTFPDETFIGTIKRIGQEAEFTPHNGQTKEERATRVFPVTIDLSEVEGLKPGMTADVYF